MRRLAPLVLAALALSSVLPVAGQDRGDIVSDRNLVYGTGSGRDLHLDLYRPRDAVGPLPLVVWVHGGGWRGGSKERCRALPLTRLGFAAASVEYRLSGEATFPAQIDDVKAAVARLREHAAEYGLDPARFGAWGSSAGGHLVALLGTSADPASRVQAVCDWFGPTDLTRILVGDSHTRAGNPVDPLLGGPVAEHLDLAKAASPVYHVDETDPPFLIMHGQEDAVVPLSQSELLHAALTRAGVESTLHVEPDAGHGFRGEATETMVREFFLRHLGDVELAGPEAFRRAIAPHLRVARGGRVLLGWGEEGWKALLDGPDHRRAALLAGPVPPDAAARLERVADPPYLLLAVGERDPGLEQAMALEERLEARGLPHRLVVVRDADREAAALVRGLGDIPRRILAGP